MPDREKVIEAFDEAKELVWTDDDEYTIGYNRGLEAGKEIAIALLKEQEEPHILTIEELWNAEVVWLEWRDKAQVKVALPFIDAQDETYLFNGTVGNFEEIPCWYKHTWVAWSARPTEEHRRKVKWE